MSLCPEYVAYMQSEAWEELKKHHPGRKYGCVACETHCGLRLHHMFYPKDIRDTQPNDCCWLCQGCHEAFHRACTGERKKYQAWATEEWKVRMIVRAQRKEEEYQPIGKLIESMMDRAKVTGEF